ncbi:hypothetical protein IV203_005487 [Nitzschia inconspicua]|uniref:Uncharacterized protein n=1 Tax=Nitzschia inconspicua TaxID=303405 RepID=A0A9K3KNK2_9STRA|nr:hypothetical protein IV203_005487 [Nitzschia inconspicua]
MKFFKKKEGVDLIELRRTQVHGLYCGSHVNPSTFCPTGSTHSKSDVGPGGGHKRSIAELAKMLNCAASKAKEEVIIGGERCYIVGGHVRDGKSWVLKRSSSWGGGLSKDRHLPSESDITRPVLITVKDGDLRASVAKNITSRNLSENAQAMRAINNSLDPHVPALKTKSSPFLFGASARNRPSEKISVVDNSNNDQKSSPIRHDNKKGKVQNEVSGPTVRSVNSFFPNQEFLNMAHDISRRERWKRGLELEKKSKDSNRSTLSGASGTGITDGEDSVVAEDRTNFTHSTGCTSYYSEEDFSSLGGYSTEGTETGDDDSRYFNSKRGCSGRGGFRSPLQLKYPSITGGQQCSSSQHVIRGISEDFGIIASFFLADGAACLGTAAAITRETVVGGCKPDA